MNSNSVFERDEMSAIEVLGYIKNDIVDAKALVSELPEEHSDNLSKAYRLIDEVQEYLYINID